MKLGRIAGVAGLIAACGCIHEIGQESSTIGVLGADCSVTGADGLGAPVSLEYDNSSLWFFPAASNITARVVDVESACRDGIEPSTDSKLALTAEEVTANDERTDGRFLRLEPWGGFVTGGVGYLYYDHVLAGPGFFDAESLGYGLCVIGDSDVCVRESRDNSTVLWPPGGRVLNRGGLVVDDRAVLLSCRRVAAFTEPCIAVGVPLDAVREPSAYQVFNAVSGWVDDAIDAWVVADHVGPLTLIAMPDVYGLVGFDIFEARFSVRLSDRATDSFDRPVDFFAAEPPSMSFAAGGRAHAGLRRSDREVVVSYDRGDGLRLASFEFFDSLGEDAQ